jgi:O-succinylbenzoate synthase
VKDGQILWDSIQVLSLPMKHRFRGLDKRELLLFRGTRRWAEWSPFTEYSDAVAARWLRASLEWAEADLPEAKQRAIPVNATWPALPEAELRELAGSFRGCKSVKLKVGGESNWEQDLNRIALVGELMPGARLRLDANGTWSISEAVRAVRATADMGIELDYLEQPVSDLDGLIELRQELNRQGLAAAIAIDETLRNNPERADLVRELGFEVVILKAAPLGGIAAAIDLANELPDLRFVVSSALESSIGLQAGLHLAAALQPPTEDCGLATSVLFESDVVSVPLKSENGEITLPANPLEPDPELTAALRANSEREQWWLARLKRCLELA